MNVKINFSVSKLAVEKLNEIVDKNSLIRIDAKSSGCSGASYSLGVEQEHTNDLDLVEEIEGLKFIVNKQSAMLLNDVVLDWHVSDYKEGFRFNNFKKSKCCRSGGCS